MTDDIADIEGIKDCCKDESNLEEGRLSQDLVVKVCLVCNCRHFELTIDPGKLGTLGGSL